MDKLQRAVDGQLSALALSKINMSEEEVERTLRGMERNPVHDNVNHPSHYETGNFECIDVMVETQGEEATKNFCVCAMPSSISTVTRGRTALRIFRKLSGI